MNGLLGAQGGQNLAVVTGKGVVYRAGIVTQKV